MTPRPFLIRLLIPFGGLLILIVSLCGAVMYQAGELSTHAQQLEDLHRLATLVGHWVPAVPTGDSSPALGDADRARLRDAARVLATRITLIDGAGKVVFDTDAAVAEMNNHNGRPEVIEARQKGVGSAVRFSDTLGEPSVYVAELLDPARPAGAVLRLSYPQRTWVRLENSAWTVIGGSIVASLLTLLLLSLLLQRLWITPTRKLAAAAEQMAAGQWHRRVEPRGASELAFFSTRLNLVASQAQQQLADLKHQRADLQALVDTLPDPILVTDSAGRLILINPPAARLMEMPAARAMGQTLVHVINDEAILQLFERIRAHPAGANGTGPDQEPVTRDIRLNRAGQRLTYQAVATRTPGGGVLLMLRDVTALTAAVQMKTDFVANASHELRTPISAIKIAFETLREVYGDDPQQSGRCMQIIDGHLKRLEEMLRDLLDLSKVERDNMDTNVRYLKTADVFTHLRSSLGPMARQKLVELNFGADGPQVEQFLADEVLLNLVLKNLVENSIKFTPPGGSVRLNFRAATEVAPGSNVTPPVVLTVADTGVGIPPEHLDRVFERFYQVDPARSGSAGRGTGLGLAIVKHAVAALDGTVQIQSTVGSGTTVTCVLPQVEQPKPADEENAGLESSESTVVA